MSARVSRPVAACWLHLLLQRRPHQVVGPPHAPYLMRWFVLPHNRFVNVYVQTFASSELLNSARALSLDPWNNLRGDRRVNSENAF
jgi:hypothetical protein